MNKFGLQEARIGYAVCGSFCTFERSFAQAEKLSGICRGITPVMSFNAASMNTRFGTAQANRERLEKICGREAIRTIEDAEPIGPSGMFDLLIVAPCTGNTLSKICCAITDTPVTMAVKSHVRCGRPVLLAIATNDALGAAAKNIGMLLNTRNFYFVPLRQDDSVNKPASLVADYAKLTDAAEQALHDKQLQPILSLYNIG